MSSEEIRGFELIIHKYSSYLLILPGLALTLLFLVIPTIIIVGMSFMTPLSGGGYTQQLTIENYIKAFSNPQIFTVLSNTFVTALVTCFITFIFGFPLAYILSFIIKSEKVKTYIISLLIVPFLVDWSIRTVAWIGILGERGIVNSFLMSLGLISKPLPLLFNRASLYLIWLQTYVLFMMFPIYLALNRINRDTILAAYALKASPPKMFYHIIFKQSLPGVITGFIFVFVSTLGDYITPALWAGGISTLGLSVQTYAGNFLWPQAAALSTILVVIALVVLYILLKIVDIKALVYE